jgi:hypothetical protein
VLLNGMHGRALNYFDTFGDDERKTEIVERR